MPDEWWRVDCKKQKQVAFPQLGQDRIEMQFDSLCKKVLRNRARDIYCKKRFRGQKEELFSELDYELSNHGGLDETESTCFSAFGSFINIKSDELTEALRRLSKRKRMIILLSYFFDMTDQEIGQHLHAVPVPTNEGHFAK